MSRYRTAAVVAAFGLIIFFLALFGSVGFGGLVLGSAAIPLAVLLLVSTRLEADPPFPALFGGATIGPAIAILSHGIVLAFGYFFFLGFAEEATTLLDRLRVDPELTSAFSSPWMVLLMVELAVVAPLTEEAGKALGARLFNIVDRRSAFLAGVAAGTGFALIENLLYATGWGFFGEAVMIARATGAAVHPLASGLVMLGVWEWRTRKDAGAFAKLFLAGAGVHAAWNGSLVVAFVTSTAYSTADSASAFALATEAYLVLMGAAAAGILWRLTVSVANEEENLVAFDTRDGRMVGAWVVVVASFLLPMAMLVLAFPDFVASG